MKDILFFNFDWVPNSTYIFKSFENCGYTCDFVNENTVQSFIPETEYKMMIVYLHERPYFTNNVLVHPLLKNTFMVQHDDTDFENIQEYYVRKPDMVMQRELTLDSKNPYNCPVYPHHFPIHSVYRKGTKKDIDVTFMGTPTNGRRLAFIEHIKQLSQNQLKHLNWFILYEPSRQRDNYINIVNRTKIGLNFPGNSYDAWRIWELASAKVATIQPKLKILSVSENHMPYDDYLEIKFDHSDLEYKINYLLENERYKDLAEKSFNSYNNFHTPEKCFEKYYEMIMKHAPESLERKPIIPLSAEPFYRNVHR